MGTTKVAQEHASTRVTYHGDMGTRAMWPLGTHKHQGHVNSKAAQTPWPHGYQSDTVPGITQALGTRKLRGHRGGTAIRTTGARQGPGLGCLIHPRAGPCPTVPHPHPCPPRPCPHAGRGVGASNRTPGSPRGSGQHGGSVRVCGDTCAGGGDTCAGGGGVRGGAGASPWADGHSLMKRWRWPCQLSPSPWTNGCLTCLWGHKAERVSGPPGWGGGQGGPGTPLLPPSLHSSGGLLPSPRPP